MPAKSKNQDAMMSMLTGVVPKKTESKTTTVANPVEKEEIAKPVKRSGGRPPMQGEKKDKTIALRVKPSMGEKLKERADELSISVNALIVMYINEGLKKDDLM